MTTTSIPTRTTRQNRRRGVSLFALVGSILAIALVLFTFRERVALTELSDRVSAIRTEMAVLEDEQRALLVTRETALSLEELEDYAVNTLGMIRPGVHNLRWIESGS